MAKTAKKRLRKRDGGPNARDALAFRQWLERQPRDYSGIVATRAALRVVPLMRDAKDVDIVLHVFRTGAIARFVAKYPDLAIKVAVGAIANTTYSIAGNGSPSAPVAFAIAFAGFAITHSEVSRAAAAAAAVGATSNAATAAAVAHAADAIYASVIQDAQQLHDRTTTPERLAAAPLWLTNAPPRIGGAWQGLAPALLNRGDHWRVWNGWYEDVLHGIAANETWDAAFTDVPGELPWDDGAEAVNTEIARRLDALKPDPAPVEGVPSPIAISRRPDGRIGADAGALAAPTIPPSRTAEDHARALSACRNLAERLKKTASSPEFKGRREYAEALAAYLDWLPLDSNSGNILLADSEARVLTKMFIADEGILADGFASRLSVFLENHIAARAFYPEVALHYQSIRTGHIATPLPHDAVEGFRETVRAHSPEVFDETVPRVMEETAKPVPEASPPAPADAPPPDASRPKPPKDPIADADPATSRSTIFARSANRIWQVLREGKDLPGTIDGWGKAYDQVKPYIGPIIDWLKTNMPGGPGGMPPAPPTISL